LSPQEIKNFPYEEKLIWFRKQIQNLKIHWSEGFDSILVDSSNILQSSLDCFEIINFHKEVKIIFQNDKVQDAGGLLREWIYIIQKQLFGKTNEKPFILADTEDTTYKINPKINPNDDKIFKLFGKVLAKSIMEKIPLECQLDQITIKQILNKRITIYDLYSHDQNLYRSFLYLKNNTLSENQYIGEFVYEQQELIQNGKNIQITEQNKNFYMEKVLKYISQKRIKPFIQAIKQSFYEVIPQNIIEVFENNEFMMIVYGLPFISLKDWKENTIYKNGYNVNHPLIISFWKILSKINQFQLAKFLHFCTGSQKIGIDGFKNLESNRGNISKFCIEQVKFDMKNPYLKAHTCFNRLELP
ncbi:uba and wwe domain protein 1, partial [Ichthyophthirius multifiliis]